MAESNNLEHAKSAFAALCQLLDDDNWYYEKNDEELSVECGARGDDLPIDITIRIDVDNLLIILLSHIPFTIQEDSRLDAAIAVCAVNNILVDGCFDYDVTSGHIFFRMTNSFIESEIGKEVFSYMLLCSCHAIDKFNDKFLMLSKKLISVEQFISALED